LFGLYVSVGENMAAAVDELGKLIEFSDTQSRFVPEIFRSGF
jgi:hypothetical protein